MSFVPKNYTTDGGDTTVIGGKLIVEEGASVEGLPSGGDSFTVFDLQGINVSAAMDRPMNVTEYIPLELLRSAMDGRKPILLRGCRLLGHIFSTTAFTVGADDDGSGTDDVVVAIAGYPKEDGTADLITIVTILLFHSEDTVYLSISPNYRLMQLINPEVPVSGVSLSESTKDVTEGDSFDLTATVEPEDAEIKSVDWSVSDDSVVVLTGTYDESADFEAVGPGTATITVTTNDGGYTAECEVTVEASEPEPDPEPEPEEDPEPDPEGE